MARRSAQRHPRRTRGDRFLRITRGGHLYILLTCFMGMAAANTQVNLLFAIFGLIVGVGVVAWALNWIMPRRLVLTRMLPDAASVGAPTTMTYRVENTKRFMPSLAISIRELDGAEAFVRPPLAYLLHVAAKRTGSIAIEVIPKRRGLHVLETYQIATSFPFGFIRSALTRRSRDSFLVHPAIGEVSPALMAMCRSADTTGESMRPREGGLDEFYGVKEYRPGDNPRQIYWRRSARTGTLVSKEMTQVAPPRLLVLVDTQNPDRTAEQYIAVEKAIAQAASLIHAALEAGVSVGVAAWAGHWLTLHPGRGKRHRRDVLATLARLPLNRSHSSEELIDAAQPLLKTGTTPVLFTPLGEGDGVSLDRRGGLITIASGSAQAAQWFTFAPTVDFTRCMPLFRYQDQFTGPAEPSPVGRSAA